MTTIEMQELAAKIAVELRALGETCHNVVTEHNPQIHFGESRTPAGTRYIWLREEKPGRITVHGNQSFKNAKGTPEFVRAYHPETHAEIDCPSIGVSASKTPKQIANDIQKRFLPRYEEYYAAAVARALASVTYENRIADNRRMFERLTGEKISEHQSGSQFTLYVNRAQENSHRLEISTSDKTCDIKFGGLTIEQAARLIEVLKTI